MIYNRSKIRKTVETDEKINDNFRMDEQIEENGTMSELYNLRFHVGVLGTVDAANEERALSSIKLLYQKIYRAIKKYNTPKYGFHGGRASIDLFADSRLSGKIWAKSLEGKDMTLNCLDSGGDEDRAELLAAAHTETSFEDVKSVPDATKTAIEWISAQSDLLLVLENGGDQLSRCVIEDRLSGRAAQVLCIRMDANAPEKLSRIGRYFSEPVSLDYLSTYLDKLYPEQTKKELPGRVKPFFLSQLWHTCYQHFIKKYSANVVYEKSPDETFTGQRKKIEDEFRRFDEEANSIAKQYREAIYFRSILPFLSTIFLAVGFYIETLLGWVLKTGANTSNIWMFVAGGGFLINALISAYAYLMKQSKAVSYSQSGFIHARYVAEFLRVAKQFCPNGVPISPYFVNDRMLMANARDILRDHAPESYTIGSNTSKQIVKSTLDWIDGQIAYHQRTRLRFEKIVKRLSKFRESVFWVGFALVILRGLIQFAMPFVRDGITNAYGSTLAGNICTFANMLALLVPTWALYFSTKLSLNNFEGLYEHSEKAISELRQLRQNVEYLDTDQIVPYEALMALSEDVLSTQISEVNDWYAQTKAKTVERL